MLIAEHSHGRRTDRRAATFGDLRVSGGGPACTRPPADVPRRICAHGGA